MLPHRLRHLNTKSWVGGAVWGASETFGSCSLAGGSMPLGVGFETFWPHPLSVPSLCTALEVEDVIS